MSSCTYKYQGKEYSTDRLLRKLVEEMPIQNQDESINFLKEFLDMSDSEITIVNGLIDGRSLGRLQQDGHTLLSNLSDLRTAKHEAFHRVWRMYLTPEERMFAIREWKTSNSNWSDLINPYRDRYSGSDNELIEEYFADEFGDFSLQPKTFKTSQPLLNFFQRIYKWLQQLMGLQPKTINSIYERILNKEFRGKPKFDNPYDVDQTIIAGAEFTIEQKQELINSTTQQFIKNLIASNSDIETITDLPETRIKNVLDNSRFSISDVLYNNNDVLDEHYLAYEADLNNYIESNQESVIWEGVKRNLKLIGFTITEPTLTEEEQSILEVDVDKSREFSPTVQVDPYSSINVKIKMLLSAMESSSPSKNYGLPTPMNAFQEYINIASKLAGVPSSEFLNELASIGLPYQSQLFDILDSNIDFRNKFISQLSLTMTQFYIYEVNEKGEAYWFNANQNTAVTKLVRQWTSNLVKEISDFDQWVKDVNAANKSNISVDSKLDVLGITLDARVEAKGLVNTIYTTVLTAIQNPAFEINTSNPFKSLKIDGYIKDLAELQAQYESQTNLMIQLGTNKLYPLNLNTQQTILLNGIRFAQSKFTSESTLNEKIALLQKYAPFIVSEYSLDNGVIVNKWLERILQGETIELATPYIGQTESGEETNVSDLAEPDLMAMHINGSLQGFTMSMKHSDRSTFFAYKMKPLYGKAEAIDENALLTGLVRDIARAIQNEVRITNLLKNNNINVQYISKEKAPRGFEEILGEGRFAELVSGKSLNMTDANNIRAAVNKQFEDYKTRIEELGLTENGENIAINKTMVSEYGSLELALATAFVNENANHIYEAMTFSGDLRVFKDGNDLFKRLAPQSSTGQLVVNDKATNDYVRNELNREHQVYNPKTKQLTTVNTADQLPKIDGTFRSITLRENEDYKSNLLDPVEVNGKQIISKLTGKPESKIFLMFENGLLNDVEIRTKKSDADIIKQIQLYEAKYSTVNENDGQSYMSFPAFKQMQIRLGNWNNGFEIIYKIEMALSQFSSLQEAKNLEIEVRPGVKFKPFESEDFLNPEINGKKIKLQPAHTLKTQFAGYTIPENLVSSDTANLWFNTIIKTSDHVLTPSAIIGTNLQMMNYTMLTQGLDRIVMGSANKVGGVDPKLAASNNLINFPERLHLQDIADRGLEFYNLDGEFNHEAIAENIDLLSYLGDWNYLKDQVAIGNKVKNNIKGSTQSLKIMLSNLVSNTEERFEGAKQLILEYKQVVDDIVKDNMESFLKEIGYDNGLQDLAQLEKVILDSSQIQSAPENVINSIKNFFADANLGLESVPMKSKIENVLYALITNNIISFDRSGTSMPIASSTGYEKFGSRKELRSGTLKFYDAKFDEEGNVTSVSPAEVIMPLPSYWVKPLMRWAKKQYGITNIIDALEQLNTEISLRPQDFEIKGLRIPNQQLSSNDWYQIKKFNLPTFTNYVVVPSETVVKAGEDFDIDKKNMYWSDNMAKKIFNHSKLGESELEEGYEDYLELNPDTTLTFEQYSKKFGIKENSSNKLLALERKLLLHPRNVHHLLLPVTDEIYVKGIYNKLVGLDVIKPVSKSLLTSIQPHTNVKKSRVFVGGKTMVGPIALSITGHSTRQADSFGNINSRYVNQNTKEAESTRLRFVTEAGTTSSESESSELQVYDPEGKMYNTLGYGVSGYTDTKGNIILESSSQRLSIAVDNVKNPVADDMMMNMQTIGVINYLADRGIDPQDIMFFINQPLIKEYLQLQKRNESLFNKQLSKNTRKQKGEKSKDKLIQDLLNRYYTPEQIIGFTNGLTSIPVEWVITSDNLSSNLQKEIGLGQQFYLAYYLELIDQSRAWSDYNQTQNSDTKGMKDRQQFLETIDQRLRVVSHDFVPVETRQRIDSEGVIAPFFRYGRLNYNIYSDLYAVETSRFGESLRGIKASMSEIAKSVDKDRLRQTLENDFLLFMIHNFVLESGERERLMIGDDSLPHRIADLKKLLPNNLVLKAFLPLLNHTADPKIDSKMSNLKLFDRELNSLDQEDLLQQVDEIATKYPEIYSDLVKLLFYQSGLNSGPFNYKSVIPVGLESERGIKPDYYFLYQDIISEGIKKIQSYKSFDEELFSQFISLFDANNPKYLSFKPIGGHALSINYNYETKKNVLKTAKNKVVPQLGSVYTKNYVITEVQAPVTVTPQVVPQGSTQENTTKQFVPKNAQQSEAITSILNFIREGNPEQWFTLEGKAGTGKTTLIQEVIRQYGTGGVVVAALSHKAKGVLSKKLTEVGLQVPAYSMAGLLGVRMNLENGKFEADPYAERPVQNASIIIVDEGSMINEAMLQEIMSAKRKNAKVIFLGDIGQLPPIRETNTDKPSPTFNTSNTYKLTERVRQGEESPILPFADLYWDNSQASNSVLNPAPFANRKNKSGAGTNLVFEQNIMDVVEDHKNLFIEAKNTKNSNLIKIVTYQNDKRRLLNEKVRSLLFTNPKEFEKGEIIIFNNNYEVSNVKIENADEFAVTDVTNQEYEFDGLTFSGYQLQSVTEKGKIINYPVVSKADTAKFNEYVSELFTIAKAAKGTSSYKTLLARAWSMRNYFADIDYAYVITSHKSQGSTYGTTIIDEADILGVGATSNVAKSQSIYTAITRSNKTSIMVNPNNPKQLGINLDSAINETTKPC